MNKTQIFIEAGKNYYGFSMSMTGQLDYQGHCGNSYVVMI